MVHGVSRVVVSSTEFIVQLSDLQKDICTLAVAISILLYAANAVLRVPDRLLQLAFLAACGSFLGVNLAEFLPFPGVGLALLSQTTLDAIAIVALAVIAYRLATLYADGEELREQRFFEALGAGTSSRIGKDFLSSLVESIVDTLQVDYAFVSELASNASSERIVAIANSTGTSVPRPLSVGKPVDVNREDLLESLPNAQAFSVPLVDSEDQLIGHICLIHDQAVTVTKRQRSSLRVFASRAAAELDRKRLDEKNVALEVKMLQVQKLESLGVLSGGIAHDFNNLLGAIGAFAALTRDAVPEHSEAQRHIRQIESVVDRSALLCNRLLAYAGCAVREDGVCDLNEIVRETALIVDATNAQHGAVDFDLCEQKTLVWGDEAQLSQVLLNLLTNAVDASGPEGGIVKVRTTTDRSHVEPWAELLLEEDRDYVFIAVHDEGCGISRDAMGRIFDPFYSTKGDGRGLGLAAVLGIVQDHGGDIAFESKVDVGTEFIVALPTTQQPAATDCPEPVSTAIARDQSVLLVDDNEMVRMSTQQMLETADVHVFAACDGQEAISVYQQNGDIFSSILLDQTMPKMSGLETCRRLRELGSTAQVILTSGYNMQNPGDESEDIHYLPKPYSRQALLKAIAKPSLQSGHR